MLEKAAVLAAFRGADASLLRFCREVPVLRPLLCVEDWEASFVAVATRRDGCVSCRELCSFFGASIRCRCGSDSAGASGTDNVTYPDIRGASGLDLCAVFSQIDRDGNGVLDKDEVLSAVHRAVSGEDSVLAEFCRQMPALQPLLEVAAWEAAFRAADTDDDGAISWFEFIRFFTRFTSEPPTTANAASRAGYPKALFRKGVWA